MLRLFVLGCLTLLPIGAGALQEVAHSGDERRLARRHRMFLEEVERLLMVDEERAAFADLRQDYQRDRFVLRFWSERDPFPQSPRNEFLEYWTENVSAARDRFDDLSKLQAQMVMLFGAEKRVFRSTCAEILVPLEIWEFHEIDGLRPAFHLVFLRLGSGRVRAWSPRLGIASLRSSGVVGGADDGAMLAQIQSECSRGAETVAALRASADWEELADLLFPRRQAHPEWVESFVSRSTDLPENAQSLPAEVAWDFPGSHQSRTVVQLMLSVERLAATVGTFGDRRAYNFLVDGEVLRRGEFFESFRYKFDIPVPDNPSEVPVARLPLAVQRYLRPGAYTWVVKLEDLNAESFFRDEIEIEVPNLRLVETQVAELPSEPSGRLEMWTEANAALENSPSGDHSIRLFAPTDRLLTGSIRVKAETTGDSIGKVAFGLDGKILLTKRRPPYSVEIGLGRAPRMHSLVATALDLEDRQLARDELILNGGPNRFSVRLIEPQRGSRYEKSVRARAEVELPTTEVLDRVEFYLNEDLVATLYQGPFVQPILIPKGQALGFVQAVAYLKNGASTEDLVFVNSPHPIEELEVNFVELYVSAFDGKGRPAEGLTIDDFTVLEDGVKQEIRRLQAVTERPIHAGVLLDTSSSMDPELTEAEEAALGFFESVIREEDRACLITFSDGPELVVPFTNEVSILAGGLAGLVADGETSLNDSLIFALHYFSGLRGKRALVLISDGEDTNSEYSFDDVLEFARRAGVAVYTVALGTKPQTQRSTISRVARDTGGQSYYVDSAAGLRSIYEKVETELRSQYLLTYQSTGRGSRDKFRAIELKVHRKGLKAKTMRGYYP